MDTKTSAGQPLHTGIGIIDSQHQTFFTILKRIQNSPLQEDSSQLSSLIEEIHLYTLYHFEAEERIMEAAEVPNLDEHKEIHQNFVETIEELRLKIILEDEYLVQEMTETIEKWFIDHILNIDKRDLEYVKNNS
ncbi:hypothetical protein D0S45_00790 [Marinifilum sp. JC120]|nr:hypothetical protein D0S45_00790 [Marinifilum sp. JC120]